MQIASPLFSGQQTVIKKQAVQQPLSPINFGATQTKQAMPKFGHLFSNLLKSSKERTTERIQKATKKANETSKKAKEQLIQSFVEQAQIPTTKLTDLKHMNLNGDKVNQLEDLLTENEDYSGLLLKGNTKNNLSLIEALCQNRHLPLLTQATGLSLSNYAHSEDGIPILESMLTAAEQVADKQGSCVVYLGDIDSLKYSETFHYPLGASSLGLINPAQGENFIKASLKQYFHKQADNDQKPSNVIIVFDKKHLEENTDESLIRKGGLNPIDMTTETEETQVERYEFLKQEAQKILKNQNIKFSDDYLKLMTEKTSTKKTDNEARDQLLDEASANRQLRDTRLHKEMEAKKAEILKLGVKDYFEAESET